MKVHKDYKVSCFCSVLGLLVSVTLSLSRRVSVFSFTLNPLYHWEVPLDSGSQKNNSSLASLVPSWTRVTSETPSETLDPDQYLLQSYPTEEPHQTLVGSQSDVPNLPPKRLSRGNSDHWVITPWPQKSNILKLFHRKDPILSSFTK